MSNSKIFTTKLTDYKSQVWYGQAMFRRYSQLNNYLNDNLSEEYAGLLAEPQISNEALKGTTNASWYSEIVSNKAVPFTSLPKSEQNFIEIQISQKLGVIKDFTEKLLNSGNPEDKKWGELINLAFDIPDLSHVFVENELFVFVVWGFKYEKNENNNFDLKKDLHKSKPILPEINDDISKDLEANDENENSKENINSETPEKENIDNENKNKPSKPDIIKEPAPEIIKKEGIEITPPTKKETIDNGNNTIINNPPPIIENRKEGKWWKKYWWLLLLLLALILLIWWLLSRNNPILPEHPGQIIPIDTTKITKDPDSTRQIVSDRLNIALFDVNKDYNAFAKRFKDMYPGSQYKIIYYDTTTLRFQIEIPADEREKIKNELKSKLPEFKLLIWYEGIFKNNYKPKDPGFSNPQMSWPQKEIKAFEAWDKTQGNSSIIVAIIDDGFDLTHPEFAGKIVNPWNVPDHSANVNTGLKSIHGTHVAGLAIGLANNNQGVSGIAPNCKFMPVQVGDFNGLMSTTSVIDGILYAIHHGANVINMSLGMPVDPRVALLSQTMQQSIINNSHKDEEKFWNELLEFANKKNIVVVIAGGNQDVLIGLDPMQRTPYTINVSAIDPKDQKAGFSNYGNLSTISAPGVHIYSSVPRGNFEVMDGTSMASPIVAGGVALLMSANPTLTFNQIVDILQKTGVPINSSNKQIGNLIQLDVAVGLADKGKKLIPPIYQVNCPDVQRQIDSLLREIEKLKQICADSNKVDTMKMPKNNKDFSFAIGRWKSTTTIINNNKEVVALYFDFFKNGKGVLTLEDPNNTICSGDLNLSLSANSFIIDQPNGSTCNSTLEYPPYHFECKPDKKGCAECTAQNKKDKSNNFKFTLVKIK